jgi:hypothetical protein
VQELVKQLTNLAVDEGEAGLNPWRIEANPDLIVVRAATRDGYPDEATAWESARRLWQAIL